MNLRDDYSDDRQAQQTHEIRGGAIRQRARLQRFGDPAFQKADCGRRTRHGHAPRHNSLFYDDS